MPRSVFNNAVRYQYAYDSSGNLSIYKDLHNHSIYFYSYDLTGRLEKITDEDGNEITYRYDSNGQLDRYYYSISGVERAVLYHYNAVNGTYNYTSYSIGSTSVTKNYNYDTDSLKRLNTIELLIGTTQLSKSFVYDDTKVDSTRGNATNRMYQVVYSKGTEDLYSHTYTYNQNHMMTQVSVMDLDNDEIIEESSYFYDGLNQLVREDVYLKDLVYETRVYAYDELNNLTSIKTYPCYVLSGTPLQEKKLIYDTRWKDQLVLIEYYLNGVFSYDETLSYDVSGNVIRIDDSRDATNQQFFDWEGRQLIDYTSPCNEVSYRYNDQGIRTQKVMTTCEGSTTIDYHLDGDKVLVETHSTGITLAYTYDVDGSLLSMNYNGIEYFYVTNLQGDVIELLDSQGNTVVSYQYDAWGTILHQTGGVLAELNPYRYRGYRYDSETQWYYLQSRYYDPFIGRFISSDGLVGEVGNVVSHNMYAYGANNPVMNVQPLNSNFVETNLLSPRYTICLFQYCYSTLPINGHHYELALNRAVNHRNPNHGDPNSVGRIVYPDGSPKQEREYGPDGRPVIDHDHHQGEDVGYDHDHDWDWNKNPPRQPARTPQKIVAIIGLMGCSAAIVWLIANDVTLVGVADDGLIVATATSLAIFWAILNEEENNRT